MTLLNNSPPVYNNEGRIIETRISVPPPRVVPTSSIRMPKKSHPSRNHGTKQNNKNRRDNVESSADPNELVNPSSSTKTPTKESTSGAHGNKPASGRFHLLLVTSKVSKKGDGKRFKKNDNSTCNRKVLSGQDELDSANSISVVQEDILGEIIIEEDDEELEISDRIVDPISEK